MADDKIDGDNQRGKPSQEANKKTTKSKKSKLSETQLLADIKETLIAQSGGSAPERGALEHLEKMSGILGQQQETLQKLFKTADVTALADRDELEGSSVTRANELENSREQTNVFEQMVQLLRDQPASIAKALREDKGGMGGAAAGVAGGFLARYLGIKRLSALGGAKGIGMGVIGVAVGLGVLIGALMLADKAAEKMGNDGSSLAEVMINLGKGLDGFGSKGLGALGMILAAGVFGGVRGGKGIAAIGIGLSGFFLALGATDKALTWMKSDYSTLVPVFKNFDAAIGSFSNTTLKTLGVLLGASAIFGPRRAALAAVGLTAIGAGIGGFFLGLAGADAGAAWMGADGSTLAKQVKHMTDAFGYLGENASALKVLGGLLVAGAIFGQAPGAAAKGAVGMGIIGLGIGAFFAGLAVADAGMGWMNSDGSNLRDIMINIAEGLSAFSGGQLAGLLAVGGIFAVVSGVPGGMAVAGMAAVGLGIAGLGIGLFIAGLAVGGKVADIVGADGSSTKKILVNIAEGLTAYNTIDSTNLLKVSAAMLAMGPAMLSLLTGSAVGAVSEVVGNVWDWVTRSGDEPDQIQQMVISLKQFEDLSGNKLQLATRNVETLSKSLATWGTIDPQRINENVLSAAAAFELMETTLIGGSPKLANLEPVISFKGLLNLDTKSASEDIEKIQDSLRALGGGITTGIEINISSLADQIADKMIAADRANITNYQDNRTTDASTTNQQTNVNGPNGSSETSSAIGY